jgi:hypothetical protein
MFIRQNTKYLILEQYYNIVFVGNNLKKIDGIKKLINNNLKIKEFDLAKLEKFTKKTFYSLILENPTSSGAENRANFFYENIEYNGFIINNADLLKKFRRDTKDEVLSFINSFKRKKKFFLFSNNEDIVTLIKNAPVNESFVFIKIK